MRVIFSDRAFASVLAETTEKITTETGGLFLGTIRDGVWYVVEAIDPGPKSVFEVAYFEYDRKYTEHLINKIANLYDRKLDLIGLWHRHPGSFDHFSSTDDGTNAKFAYMRQEGAISGLVNIDPVFRLTMYHVGQPCRYQVIPYEVGDGLIPQEFLAYKSPERFYDLMEKRSAPTVRNPIRSLYTKTVSLHSFMEFVTPYLTECADDGPQADETEAKAASPEEMAEAILDDLTFMTDTVGVQVTLAMQNQTLLLSQEAIDQTTELRFSANPQKDGICLSYNGKCYAYQSGALHSAAEKAKAEKDRQNTDAVPEAPQRKPVKVFDSVIRMIKFGKSEDENNGN